MTETANGVTAAIPAHFDGRVIVAQQYADNFVEAMFSADYWRARDAVIGNAGGRGQVFFVDTAEEHWVLRHYHRGGIVAPLLRDRYLWLGGDRTRTFSEWRLLADLYAAGLPVPRPVAARYIRHGFYYRADLLTVLIPGAFSLTEIVAQRLPADSEWQAIGACIRRFHDAGVCHADLNASNIVIDDKGGIFLVDFDRGRIATGTRWKKANLRRLNRSLHKIGLSLRTPEFEQRQWPALLAGYERAPDAGVETPA